MADTPFSLHPLHVIYVTRPPRLQGNSLKEMYALLGQLDVLERRWCLQAAALTLGYRELADTEGTEEGNAARRFEQFKALCHVSLKKYEWDGNS
jgi:hypothetical protein